MKFMKDLTFPFLLVFALTCFLGCNTSIKNSQADLEEATKAIAESNAIYFDSFARNDSSIFIERYAEDCEILAPNALPFVGHKGAAEFFRLGYDAFGLRNGKFTTTDIFGEGKDYVTEYGQWQSFDSKGTMFDDGKFLVLWKKTPKGWKMFRDSFSSNHLPGGN
jgi:ketosteroid isomerase-like protein